MRFLKASAVAASGIVLALGLASCGWNHDTADAAKAVTAGLTIPGSQFTQTQANCVGKSYADALGAKKLIKYGYVTADLKKVDGWPNDPNMTKADAQAAAGAVIKCVDISNLLADQLKPEYKTPDVLACFKKTLTNDKYKSVLAAQFSGDTNGASTQLNDLTKSALTCLPQAAASPSAAASPAQ